MTMTRPHLFIVEDEERISAQFLLFLEDYDETGYPIGSSSFVCISPKLADLLTMSWYVNGSSRIACSTRR